MTEDDFDEAREVMSGEYSNQPVGRSKPQKLIKNFATEIDFDEAREL